ncbi:CO dehydrogenase nickel-insertion accessory protein CooC [Thermococcus sp. M39]|uniref:ATP-binding protein n=1 Tax=unclassified Thermococcus TaxID=2627626 RepID=UPI00143A5FA4|nr:MULTISPECIES: P-loop NTPase [unclassified Thermococcus]NJE08816.1 CO dehydrogenase nickel-insertion accessory protein CooC [Thermococcus sp. M39]NJE13477.1 CO dehydrogenase nickel-insertion accessory protein CooC [Thermococcus sp. LS2]
MKILVAGKGGVGKTTISALLAHILADKGYNVLALDTDSVPNLAQSLGIPFEEALEIIPLSRNEKLAEERTGARPGEGWGVLFSLTPKVDDLAEQYGITIKPNLKLVVVGSIEQSKEGCLCPALALARAFLMHVLLSEKDIVIVDSEAGAEVFGRGLAEKFDVMICVAEPTLKSLMIARKLIEMGRQLNISHILLVINKVHNSLRASQLYAKVFSDSTPYHLIGFDENVISVDNEGKGVDAISKDSPVYRDVEALARKILSIKKRSKVL